MTDALPSADHLDQIVLAVPGVDVLYCAAPLATVISLARDALANRPAPSTSVLVTVQNDALRVKAKIGVVDGYAAAAVCRRVHDALEDHLSAMTRIPVAEIAVTVARIG